jgi:hypothetical protein
MLRTPRSLPFPLSSSLPTAPASNLSFSNSQSETGVQNTHFTSYSKRSPAAQSLFPIQNHPKVLPSPFSPRPASGARHFPDRSNTADFGADRVLVALTFPFPPSPNIALPLVDREKTLQGAARAPQKTPPFHSLRRFPPSSRLPPVPSAPISRALPNEPIGHRQHLAIARLRIVKQFEYVRHYAKNAPLPVEFHHRSNRMPPAAQLLRPLLKFGGGREGCRTQKPYEVQASILRSQAMIHGLLPSAQGIMIHDA